MLDMLDALFYFTRIIYGMIYFQREPDVRIQTVSTLILYILHSRLLSSSGCLLESPMVLTLWFCSYNNQWMVVDYKLFERGQANLQDGLLWVLEQLP